MPNTSYIFKFKTTDTAQEALEQIDSNGYILPYHSGGMPVVKFQRGKQNTRELGDKEITFLL